MRWSFLLAAGVTVVGLVMVGNATAADVEPKVRPAAAPLSPAASAVVARWRAALAAEENRTASQAPLSVADDLKRRVAIEQVARKAQPDWPNSGLSGSDRAAAREAIWNVIRRLDRENTDYLKTVLPADGWFRSSRDGEQIARDAWLIVQHSPEPAFQRRVLDLMTPLVATGDADGGLYALLYDRVAIHEGKPQRFGSQIVCNNGRFEPDTMEDPARLDERRASVGLPPMAEYLRYWDGKSC